eukprot:TRINITY_DN1545_c0_g1_i1.p1 TRINITY_DN1545_c0_g1~~TRINITY_DN1545_c0_g1_i1.p1  ORF type:complete len:1237 (+),score=327.94 TRINITY_DN1545_c0_g1_i1:47-3757(+)
MGLLGIDATGRGNLLGSVKQAKLPSPAPERRSVQARHHLLGIHETAAAFQRHALPALANARQRSSSLDGAFARFLEQQQQQEASATLSQARGASGPMWPPVQVQGGVGGMLSVRELRVQAQPQLRPRPSAAVRQLHFSKEGLMVPVPPLEIRRSPRPTGRYVAAAALPSLLAARNHYSFGGMEDSQAEPAQPSVPAAGGFHGAAALAKALVERAGSLERAFASFDYNRKGKVTRTQFDTTLGVFRLNVQDLCGVPAKQIFKMMDCLDGPGRGEVQLEQWTRFFGQQLQGTEAAWLLSEDRGDQTARQRAEFQIRKVGRWRQSSRGHADAVMAAGSLGSTCEPVCSEAQPELPDSPPSPVAVAWHDSTAAAADAAAATSTDRAGAALAPDQVEAPHGSDGEEENATPWPLSAVGARGRAGGSDPSTDSDSDSDGAAGGALPLPPPPTQSAAAAAEQDGGFLPSGGSATEEAKLQATAEQEQYAEELKELDLSGIEALAYVLVAKFGSLRQAFKWFDSSQRGKIAQVVWDNGMALLHIDTEKLTGWKSSAIFALIDRATCDGYLTRKEWKQFFVSLEEGSLGEQLKHAAASGAQRAEQVEVRKRRLRAAGGSKGPAGKKPSQATEEPGGLVSSRLGKQSAGEAARERARDKLQEIACDEPAKAGVEDADRSTGLSSDDLSPKLLPVGSSEEEALWALREESFRARARRELLALAPGECLTYCANRFRRWQHSASQSLAEEASEPNQDDDDHCDLLPPEHKSAIVAEIAEDLDLWSHDTKRQVQPGLARSGSVALSRAELAAEPGGVLLVCHLRSFADDVYLRLNGLLGTGASLEFPAELSEAQRLVVHVIGAETGLSTLSEGSGEQRRVVAYDTGDFASQLRKLLEAIKPDETQTLSTNLSAAQRRLVHIMALELGLTVTAAGEGLKVFNLQDFAARLREELGQLGEGEERELPTDFSEAHRQVAQAVASELGLAVRTLGSTRGTLRLAVANLRDFLAAARARMQALWEPEEIADFGPGLTMAQKTALEALAKELGLHARLSASGDVLSVSLSDATLLARDAAAAATAADAAAAAAAADAASAAARCEEGADGHDECNDDKEEEGEEDAEQDDSSSDAEEELPSVRAPDSQESMIHQVFEAYASGNHRGQRVFLRYSDLREFAEDVKGVMPQAHQAFHRFTGILEFYFDETLQLQADLGERGGQGLTLRWFQVFVQKAIRRLGLQIVGVLFALLDGRQ